MLDWSIMERSTELFSEEETRYWNKSIERVRVGFRLVPFWRVSCCVLTCASVLKHPQQESHGAMAIIML